ncbi:hypothetical protein DEJ49_33240 [Streptomyces venezuelae]|uniref:SpdD protein n=1 Tax=Streptomyces venezuelae TaxID=54571 RepID=A0A5P2CQM8_STRVZ|nr:hypothetical protein [Streptomyces venezuelae]QES45206.1 hypothetical protein DEJ49_33240 [Streptomyces venezuelae]
MHHPPLQPWLESRGTEPQAHQYLGTDTYGRPVYGKPATPPATGGVAPAVAPLQPLVARPWGAYIAGGCLGVIALAVLGTVAVFVMLGLAAVALAVALSAVALTVCVLVLRSVWSRYLKEK